MKISSLEKRKQHLTAIVFDDGKELLLDNDTVLDNGLKVGTDISDEQIGNIKFESDYKRAKSRALWYLDSMDYTEKKLYEKLLTKGFDRKACAEVMRWLTENRFVDDRRYAERLAERFAESNVSKREAVMKMVLKGVSPDMAKEVMSQIEVDEQSQILAVIEKKYALKLCDEKGRQNVYAALVRKGFSYSDVRAALKKYCDENEFCEDQ